MSWTDERVSLLRKMWVEGKTAAEIAKELGGVTRNAVIGKAHRLKLSNRVSPIQQNKKPVAPVKAPVEKKIEKILLQDNSKPGIDLLDLKNSMCCWPKGDPRDENFGFCGEEAIVGLPYCGSHAKVAYQAATRNRILQAEDFEEKAAKSSEEDVQEVKAAAKR